MIIFPRQRAELQSGENGAVGFLDNGLNPEMTLRANTDKLTSNVRRGIGRPPSMIRRALATLSYPKGRTPR